jgi:uncharacterized protein
MLNDAVGASVVGIATGALRESLRDLVDAGVDIHVSGGSSQARGVTEDDLADKNARFASPNDLVRLTFAADRVLVY